MPVSTSRIALRAWALTRTLELFTSKALKLNPVLPSTLPVLFVGPTAERFVTPETIEQTRPFVPSMEVVRPEGGHYIMIEKGDEVAQMVGDWLETKLK